MINNNSNNNSNISYTFNGQDLLKEIFMVKSDKGKISKFGSIYMIHNIKNSKFYIGSIKNTFQRWTVHFNQLLDQKHHSIHLQRAWNMYHCWNFEFSTIEVYLKEDFKNDKVYTDFLREREQIYLDTYQTYEPEIGYNINRKAVGGGRLYTYEDLKNGKCPFTEDQFWRMVEELKDPYISVTQLARDMDIKEKYVQKVADMGYLELCKDIFIPKRQPYFQNRDYDLEEYGIAEIIEELGLN